MKERWSEMLEYQQKVQAMTDLERAQFWLDATTGLIFPEAGVVASLASLIAAARREGEERAQKTAEAVMEAFAHRMKQTGAEEMRERAAQEVEDADRSICAIARAIRALPLTPEEPPKRQPVAPSADPDVSVCGRLIASHPIKEPE